MKKIILSLCWLNIRRNKSTEKQRGHHTTSGFAKLGGGVTTQTVVGARTAGDSPNCLRLNPQLRKATGTLSASGGQCSTVNLISEMKIDETDKK